MAAVVFDLDDTLIDTSALIDLRNKRQWRLCVNALDQTHVFDGIPYTLEELHRRSVQIGLVTSSVSFYASNILRHHKIGLSAIVAYHDCRPRKPAPNPIFMCLEEKMGVASPFENAIGVGDTMNDCIAYKRAGLISAAAGWSLATDLQADWDIVLKTPQDLIDLVQSTIS